MTRTAPPHRPPHAPSPASHGGHLDPRAPFVLDTRELGRRPGSMRRVQRDVPAPADFRLEVVGVPTGEPVTLDLRLEAVMDGVLVTGVVTAPLTGECGRCLEPVTDELEVDVQELFAYEPVEGDDDISVLQGDLLDLEPAVRDAVVLALPLAPLCADDCPGLCPTCGAQLAADPEHHHDTVDPRWAALGSLLAQDEPDDETNQEI